MKTRYITFTAILLALGSFALSPIAQAVVPAPDGGYPGFTIAEGDNALFSLTSGAGNTAVGWYSLKGVTAGSFKTAIGAGTLLANTADQNTAVGVGGLSSNFTGADNTANGALALFSNITGTGNTAMGINALFSNSTADSNTAVGWNALALNTTGTGNTAFGVNALVANVTGSQNTGIGLGALFSTTGDNNIALGFGASADLTGDSNIDIGVQVRGLAGENNTIRIGDNLPQGGQSNCYIGGIRDGVVNFNHSLFVVVDPAGKLGISAFAQELRFRDVIEDHKKIEQLEATVATLAGQLKGQTAQVQKMSARLAAASPFPGGREASTTALQVVNNP